MLRVWVCWRGGEAGAGRRGQRWWPAADGAQTPRRQHAVPSPLSTPSHPTAQPVDLHAHNIRVLPPCRIDPAMGRASTASGGRKRARDEDDVKEVEEEEIGHHADTPRPATSSQIDAMLEQTMRAIVGARTYPSSACPSPGPSHSSRAPPAGPSRCSSAGRCPHRSPSAAAPRSPCPPCRPGCPGYSPPAAN